MTSSALPKGVRLMRGRFQARVRHQGRDHVTTWDTETQAVAWLRRTRRELAAGTYADQQVDDPDTGRPLPPLLSDYIETFLNERDLKPRTRTEYRGMATHLAPLGHWRLDQLTREHVKTWHARLKLTANRRAHVYSLLRTILNAAVDDELIDASPARIKGAGKQKRTTVTEIPTPAQVHALADAMPSAKYRTMTLVAAWCGLRFGETTELRRKDLVLDQGGVPAVIRVRRAVVHNKGVPIVGDPKSTAGVRDVTIPPHIRSDLADYLATRPAAADTLLFPGTRTGEHLKASSLYRPFYRARERVGLPTLRWHDLRHFAGTMAAQSGGTLREVQARIGHSTVAAALRYQHAAEGRDAVIAEAMSNVIPLRPPA